MTTPEPENQLEQLDPAEQALEAGRIVAFPTETVYGLCVRGDDTAAIERLFEAKGRPPTQPLAHYVADASALDDAPPAAHRVADAYWPGPITLVVPAADGETRGLRCSSHPFITQLAQRCSFPIVGTSANMSGEAPLRDSVSIQAAFGDAVSLIIEGSLSADNLASTVASIDANDTVTVLREGALSETDICEVARKRILFVCTGNTCRSPLAEAICRAALDSSGLAKEWACRSAGIAAVTGALASGGSTRAASFRGLDLSEHRSSPATESLLLGSNIVCTMTEQHSDILLGWDHRLRDRVRTLGGSVEVPDPFGADDGVYDICAATIEKCVRQLMEEL